jgi:DNA-binding GntR family transcriptional regulator
MHGNARREPAYRTVADDLRATIRASKGDGARLPTEVELAERYGLSRQTIRRAYRDLVAEGVVKRIPGRGTFPVAPSGFRTAWSIRSSGSIEDLLTLSLDTELEIIQPLQLVARPAAASLLGLQLDDVYELALVRHHEGKPYCYTTIAVPSDLAERLRAVPLLWRVGGRSPATFIGLVDSVVESSLTGAKQTVAAVATPEHVARFIDCEPDAPVLCIERLYFAGDGRPVEFAVTYYNSERYSYRLLLQRSS